MPAERLPMRKVKEILRMKWALGLSHRTIEHSLGTSIGTISKLGRQAKAKGLDWASVEGLSEEQVEAMLYAKSEVGTAESRERPMPGFAEVHAERKKPGVTLQLLHIEYLERHAHGYGYTQFCAHYRRWLKNRGLTMRQEHRAGDKLFVDYSGKKPHTIDPKTGEPVDVELFVAALGASNYTFAEATATQQVPDFVSSHVRAFAFFGGVTAALVPDQLKSGVTGASRYEPTLQRTYEDLAEHYGTAVIPARPGKPRDKAKVEIAVQVAQRWILARLRKQTFFSLDELNVRIRELVADLNARTMRRYGASRAELFERIERGALRPLPMAAYVFGTWSKAKVRGDYHVEVAGHLYSVPHRLVGDVVEMRATAHTIEVLRRGKRVAVHVRNGERGGKTTNPEHLPVAHRRHLEWTPERISAWAAKVGASTLALTTAILAERPHPEQGYRSCLGILRLSRRYGDERLERACARALGAGARSYPHIESILKNGLDRLEPAAPAAEVKPIAHANVRGAAYYDN